MLFSRTELSMCTAYPYQELFSGTNLLGAGSASWWTVDMDVCCEYLLCVLTATVGLAAMNEEGSRYKPRSEKMRNA
jgi:hypothetical protein